MAQLNGMTSIDFGCLTSLVIPSAMSALYFQYVEEVVGEFYLKRKEDIFVFMEMTPLEKRP